MNKPWKPPFLCRWYKHKFEPTEYLLPLLPIFPPSEVLFVCKRCGAGTSFTLLGQKGYTQPAVAHFKAVMESRRPADSTSDTKENVNVFPLDFSKKNRP